MRVRSWHLTINLKVKCENLGAWTQRTRQEETVSDSRRVNEWCGARLSVHQLLHHQLGVAKAAGQLLAAAKLLQQRQFVGAEVSFLVDVGHRSHEGTQDQLGVVLAETGTVSTSPPTSTTACVDRATHLEEVDLNGAVGQVQHDGALGPEPEGEVGQPGQLVPFPPGDVGAGLQQVLAHVVAEVFQQGDL